MEARDFAIVQGMQPPGLLKIEPSAIAGATPGILVAAHICEGCRDHGGEIHVAMIDRDGVQRGVLVFPPEQALQLASSLVAHASKHNPRIVQ